MKKALLLVSILFISVVSTACINNFAVQELNNKAKAFIDQGDYTNAIERLKSSIDLDDTVFESHYNLAVAYTAAEDYPNAIEAYKKAIALNPDFADAYYSLAVAEEDYAADLAKGELKLDNAGQPVKVKEEEIPDIDKLVLTPETLKLIDTLLEDAVKQYGLYLQKGVDIKDGDDVRQKIDELNLERTKNNEKNSKA